jgi:UDP-glucose 4-epimerase
VKVLVFGGGGFIGSTIVDQLLEDSHEVVIFERPRVAPFRRFSSTEKVEWLTGDILSEYDIDAAIQNVDAVIHLVSTTLPRTSNDDPVYDVQSNIVGTLGILKAMAKHDVRRIVFISSGGTVYGNPVYLPVDENHPTNPQVSYGVTKLAIEKYLLIYERMHGIRPVILRVANPYGERQRIETAQGAVGVFIHRALHGQPIEIWGDGSITRDFLHVADVAAAFVKALRYEGNERIFNIGSGKGTSLNELIDELRRQLGLSIEAIYQSGRSFDVPVSVLCNALAQSELGWTPQVDLDDGIARTICWARQQLRSESNF